MTAPGPNQAAKAADVESPRSLRKRQPVQKNDSQKYFEDAKGEDDTDDPDLQLDYDEPVIPQPKPVPVLQIALNLQMPHRPDKAADKSHKAGKNALSTKSKKNKVSWPDYHPVSKLEANLEEAYQTALQVGTYREKLPAQLFEQVSPTPADAGLWTKQAERFLIQGGMA